MPEGHVLYAHLDHVHVLRYVGDIRHPVASSVGSFVDSLLGRMDHDALMVDLSSAEAIDSTNLGEIARLAVLLDQRGQRRATILSTRPGISQVLRSMAFDEVFDICHESAHADAGGEPIPKIDATPEEARNRILAAHRHLMEMSEDNRQRFAEVVELLEREH